MSPHPGQMCVRIERDALFDPLAVGAFLAAEVRFHRQHRASVEHPIVLHPAQERAPSRIVDGLGEVPVALHVPYLQVLKGKEARKT